jgi:hypothetical protein
MRQLAAIAAFFVLAAMPAAQAFRCKLSPDGTSVILKTGTAATKTV